MIHPKRQNPTNWKRSLALIGLILVTAASGCATSGAKYSEMESLIHPPPPEMGRIYIYRNSAFGAAIQPKVHLNGEVVGGSIPNGFFYVDRPPGSYQIKTSTEVKRTLSLMLEDQETRYVRLNVSMGFFVGHVYPELVEADEGRRQITNLRYTGEPIAPASIELEGD